MHVFPFKYFGWLKHALLVTGKLRLVLLTWPSSTSILYYIARQVVYFDMIPDIKGICIIAQGDNRIKPYNKV